VFSKSSLMVVAPLTLVPLVAPVDRRPLARAAAAFVIVLALWAYFDFARFGHLFGGYSGERFSHPFFDGLWRLTIGPNKGLLFYFPALIATIWCLVRAGRAGDWRRTTLVAGPVICLVLLLGLASPWWAWHGDDGWGPRLLVPALPLLGVWAAIETDNWSRWARLALLVVSVAVNLPPLLQHPAPVFAYRASSTWPSVDPDLASGLPHFAQRAESGKIVVIPDTILSTVPSASPFVLLPWFFRATHASSVEAARTELARPPWIGARPDITSPANADAIAQAPRRPFGWGRTLIDGGAGLNVRVYDEGLADQVIRAQQLRRLPQALDLARKLEDLAPTGFADALLLESYRLLHRRPDAVALMGRLPVERRSHPSINVVLALFERDRGNESAARALLGSVADSFPDSPVSRALTQPLAQWPADFAAMTLDESLQVAR
jgi:hypothetical protein